MQPNERHVTLGDNRAQIARLLSETIIEPRKKLLKWSRITHQTANIRIGYPGQHLASLVTGVEGTRTGARGHDLADGSEVKSCSRIDQLDKCAACNASVSRAEEICPVCGASDITRKDDSKWLFGIRSEEEHQQLIGYNRVLLMLGDYPNFAVGDYETLRFQAFEIWPQAARSAAFASLMTGYFENIYKPKLAASNKQPAPKNFWPYSFQFYKCNPVRTMLTTVRNASSNPEIDVEYLFEPKADRSALKSRSMPAGLLKKEEASLLKSVSDDVLEPCLRVGVTASEFRATKVADLIGKLDRVHPEALARIPLRHTDRPVTHRQSYRRSQIS